MVGVSRLRSLALIAAAGLVITGTTAQAASSQLDPSFGENGLLWGSPDGVVGHHANPLAVQPLPDGSLLIAGALSDGNPGHVLMVAKVSANGAFTEVGTDQVATGTSDAAYAMVVDRAGNIVVAGQTDLDGVQQQLVERFHPDLTLDTTFGVGGRVLVPNPSGTGRAVATAVQEAPDGSYVVGGSRPDADRLTVARLRSDGTLDPAFSTDGIATLPADNGGLGGLAVTPDDRVVLFGRTDAAAAHALVARLTQGGALDPTFSGDGKLLVGGAGFGDGVRLPDGSYVATGLAAKAGNRWPVRLVRISGAGALQNWPGTSSSQRNLANSSPDNPPQVKALALAPDEKLVFAGDYATLGGGEGYRVPYVGRATSAGVYDTSFGDGGEAVIVYPGAKGDANFSDGSDVAVDAQGRVVVTGRADVPEALPPEYDVAGVARFTGSVSPRTPTFEIGQGLSTWARKSCGTTTASACPVASGGKVRVEGRVWPVPTGGTVTVNLVPASGDKIVVEVPVTREGTFWVTRTPPDGSYAIRAVTPASGTTTLARSPWTYVTVS